MRVWEALDGKGEGGERGTYGPMFLMVYASPDTKSYNPG